MTGTAEGRTKRTYHVNVTALQAIRHFSVTDSLQTYSSCKHDTIGPIVCASDFFWELNVVRKAKATGNLCSMKNRFQAARRGVEHPMSFYLDVQNGNFMHQRAQETCDNKRVAETKNNEKQKEKRKKKTRTEKQSDNTCTAKYYFGFRWPFIMAKVSYRHLRDSVFHR